MFGCEKSLLGSHQYTLAAYGIKFKNRVFGSREAATQTMYNICHSLALSVECIDDSKHYKGYSAGDGIFFYIDRTC